MSNVSVYLPLELVGAVGIVIVALIAISQPKSRIKSAKRSLKEAHRFSSSQIKLGQIIGGKK